MKYTYELLEPLVKSSTSFAEVARKLGLKPNGGRSNYVKQRVLNLQIDYSHFLGSGWMKDNRRKHEAYRRKIEDVLIKKSPGSCRDGNRLLTRALLEIGRSYNCEMCGLKDMWHGKPISLQIDHIDGDALNNTADNIRFLCPNCHSQTHNYCRPKSQESNSRTGYMTAQRWHVKPEKPIIADTGFECACGKPKHAFSKECLSCACKKRIPTPRAKKIHWPDIESLRNMVASSSYVAVGKTLGVSDNAVRKHLKRYESVAK